VPLTESELDVLYENFGVSSAESILNKLVAKQNRPFWTVCVAVNRVWKGILGIRDLTKIWCGIRENEKYLEGIRDLTATREAGLAKIWVRDAGFCCLTVGNSGNRHDPNKRCSGKRESTRRAQDINEKGQSTS